MAQNLDRIVSVSNANLFKLAAQLLGDATQWNRIARINGLTDFIVPGNRDLRIPPSDLNAGNGGILEA